MQFLLYISIHANKRGISISIRAKNESFVFLEISKSYPNFIIHKFYLIFAIIYFRMDKSTEEFYERLRTELNSSTTTWPAEYLFKFIVPSDKEKVEKVENAFNSMGAVIETKHSKTGKYTSVSIDVQMQNAEAIIDKYLELSTIKGIISL
jgi:putative lipoic acid-binding regulatory protein